MSRAPRWFRLLLHTLPEEFREDHEADIRDLVHAYTGDRRGPARGWTWIRAAIDVLWVGISLRIGRRRAGVRMQARVRQPRLFASIVQDVRYAFRSLRRDAGLAVFATLIVGLGVGASATVFSVASALLLRPLPFHQPDELVWISNGEWGRGQQLSELSVQVSHLQDLRARSTLLSDVAGYSLFDREGDHTLTSDGAPERLTRLGVTENFFQLLGVAPRYGRLFTAEEVRSGGPNAVLLDHRFWMRRFAGDPGVVGRSIIVDGAPTMVVGVLPASFDFAAVFAPGNPIDFVAPFPLSPETNRQGNTLVLIGRLRPGASLPAARTEAEAIATLPTNERRNTFSPHLVPLREHVSGGFQPAVVVLTCAVGLVMLIVCANLSNLLLARGTSREREIAIRRALGAGRSRLIRQMLTESVLLASAGAGLGLFLAAVGTSLLTQAEVEIPLLSQARVDTGVLGFTLGIAVATGILFGITPALRTSAGALSDVLRAGGRGSSAGRQHTWMRDALVVAEVALACMLLIGASLLMRSLARLMDVDLGFQPQHAVALRIDPSVRLPSHDLRVAYYDEALRRVRSAPTVEVAAVTDVLPTAFNRRWCVQDQDELCPFVRVVSERYLDAMGLSLIAGRDFTAGDNTATGFVTIVNQQLADALWPGLDPVGRTFRVYPGEWRVIGVVRGTRQLTPEQEPGPEMFFPFRQLPHSGAMHLITRGGRTLEDLAATVRGALAPLDANLPVNDVRPIGELIERSISPRRFVALLLGGFAAFALLLASLGIYGVISYSVGQRKQEMGIRMALGASAAHLRHRVLAETLRLAVAGMAIGLVASSLLARTIRGLLFGITASDPVTYAMATVVLLTVAAVAGYLPAQRVTQFDPVESLRAET